MRCWKFVCALAAFVSLCCAVPIRADEQVPFKGHFDPVIVSVTSLGGTLVRFDVDVFAQATILGKTRGPAYFILDMSDFTYVGETTWVTSNGDTLSQSFGGQFVPTGTPGLFDNVEYTVVTGGTGRFAGASGSAVAGGQFDAIAVAAPAPIPFAGTISSPGASRNP